MNSEGSKRVRKDSQWWSLPLRLSSLHLSHISYIKLIGELTDSSRKWRHCMTRVDVLWSTKLHCVALLHTKLQALHTLRAKLAYFLSRRHYFSLYFPHIFAYGFQSAMQSAIQLQAQIYSRIFSKRFQNCGPCLFLQNGRVSLPALKNHSHRRDSQRRPQSYNYLPVIPACRVCTVSAHWKHTIWTWACQTLLSPSCALTESRQRSWAPGSSPPLHLKLSKPSGC